MHQFRFREWEVYKDSQNLLQLIFSIVRGIPKEFRFEIGSQIIRSALSISLNIAEGSGKSSDKDMSRFFDIALGSAYETLAALDVLRYNNIISVEKALEAEKLIATIVSQLGGFKKKLQ